MNTKPLLLPRPAAAVKRCSTCNEVKSVDDFANDRTKPDNKRSNCRACHSARRNAAAEYEAAAQRAAAAAGDGTKLCHGCGERKPTAEFARNATKADGLQSRCKPCARADQRESTRRRSHRAAVAAVRQHLAAAVEALAAAERAAA